MTIQDGLARLNVYVSTQERQLYQAKARARRLSISRYLRSLFDADVDGQVERNQRIDCLCRQLLRDFAELKVTPNLQESRLFTDSIARVQKIQQEVRGS